MPDEQPDKTWDVFDDTKPSTKKKKSGSGSPLIGPSVGKPETEEGRIKGDTYSKKKFYIGGSDGPKEGKRLRMNKDRNASSIRVPTYVWALANKWVEDGRTPYRAVYDMIRDAVVHRLHELEEIVQDNPAEWEGFRIQSEMATRISIAERHKDTIKDIKESLATAWSDGDTSLFYATLDDAERLVKEMPHPYNKMLQSVVEEQRSVRRLDTGPTA